MTETEEQATLAMAARRLRLTEPFRADEIELLPKPLKKDSPAGLCKTPDANGVTCGRWHPLPAIHLRYVGHAGVTGRLCEVDPAWNWEPMALDKDGLPLVRDGVLWIRLTVLGVTRLGVGDAAGKTGPNAIKEMVGDGIRNAAMRFVVGTYLWSKSEHAAQLVGGAEDEEPAIQVNDERPVKTYQISTAPAAEDDGAEPQIQPGSGTIDKVQARVLTEDLHTLDAKLTGNPPDSAMVKQIMTDWLSDAKYDGLSQVPRGQFAHAAWQMKRALRLARKGHVG